MLHCEHDGALRGNVCESPSSARVSELRRRWMCGFAPVVVKLLTGELRTLDAWHVKHLLTGEHSA